MIAPVDCQGYRWRVGRGVTVSVVIEGRALAATRYEVEFRAFESLTGDAFLAQVELAETQAGDPWAGEGHVTAFSAAHAQVNFEVVVIDTHDADENSVSGYREEVVQDWVGAVIDAPVPG